MECQCIQTFLNFFDRFEFFIDFFQMFLYTFLLFINQIRLSQLQCQLIAAIRQHIKHVILTVAIHDESQNYFFLPNKYHFKIIFKYFPKANVLPFLQQILNDFNLTTKLTKTITNTQDATRSHTKFHSIHNIRNENKHQRILCVHKMFIYLIRLYFSI